MASLEEIRQNRMEKLQVLIKRGINPYPSNVPRDSSLLEFQNNFEKLETEKKVCNLAGRIMAIRGQGAILFVVLDDGTAKFQAVFKKDSTAEDIFNLFVETTDIGDFISVSGQFFKTSTGEKSVLVSNFIMASKYILPLPEKWHGLTDSDERFRKRYLDLLIDKD